MIECGRFGTAQKKPPRFYSFGPCFDSCFQQACCVSNVGTTNLWSRNSWKTSQGCSSFSGSSSCVQLWALTIFASDCGDCGIVPDVPGKFPLPRNYVMSPFLWEPSESVSCPVFGLTLRIVASRFSSLGCVFFFFGGGSLEQVHFVSICFCKFSFCAKINTRLLLTKWKSVLWPLSRGHLEFLFVKIVWNHFFHFFLEAILEPRTQNLIAS